MSDRVQGGFAVWFTGLPASGKTTLAKGLQAQLAHDGIPTQLLDSDELRSRLIANPVYSEAERSWFYDLIVFLADLLASNGVNVLIAATGQKRAYRNAARTKIDRFCEVYIACQPAVCRRRDPKGLWERAERGEIHNFPGADAAYEAPLSPEVVVHNDQLSIEQAVALIHAELARQGCLQ